MEDDKEKSVEHFLNLIRKSKRGKFKVYIGMSAGVGKSYRMLQEAHNMLKNSIDIKIGYIETINEKKLRLLLPRIQIWQMVIKGNSFNQLLKKLSGSDIDLFVLS